MTEQEKLALFQRWLEVVAEFGQEQLREFGLSGDVAVVHMVGHFEGGELVVQHLENYKRNEKVGEIFSDALKHPTYTGPAVDFGVNTN